MLSNFHYVIFLKTESVDTYYKADKEKANVKALRQHSILEQQQIDIKVTHWIAVQPLLNLVIELMRRVLNSLR